MSILKSTAGSTQSSPQDFSKTDSQTGPQKTTEPLIYDLKINNNNIRWIWSLTWEHCVGRGDTPRVGTSPSHTLIHAEEQFNRSNPAPSVCLRSGRKPEKLEETHTDTRRTCETPRRLKVRNPSQLMS